ncbi:hypothetical protein BLNAU_15285 [Blattamonas nauphoetae]|uniref:Uncharacterized protein n=1 Tax=Blattamonas nauphoetae TaxID=2049346 RepID=A0ABQ9XET0_9EUKA|nr:hypothetical protein BLNAU_15285 [Blattamonas nauphoetae]
MFIDKTSTPTKLDSARAKQVNLVEVFLSQICGDCWQLRPLMLKSLLVLVSSYNWTRSALLDMEYIPILERYCETASSYELPTTLPKLLSFIGRTSEDELDRICESSIPSFFIKWMMSTSKDTANTELCFSQHPEVSKLALKAIITRCNTDRQTPILLRQHKVPSDSNKGSSTLVPFAGRLCEMLASRVSELKIRFLESSPSDGTISAHSATLHSESPLLTGNAVFEVLCDGFSLLNALFLENIYDFEDILVEFDFAPLLKSTIIVCLDLLDQKAPSSQTINSNSFNFVKGLINISWHCAASSIWILGKSLDQVVVNTFSDIPLLCSLLDRTCCSNI